jgi:hypothetical protein
MAMETMVAAAAICAAFALISLHRRLTGQHLNAATVKIRARAHSILHPYRPELHYMRGPGPKCQEKHLSAGRFE